MGAQNTKAHETFEGHLTAEEMTNLKKLFNTFNTQVASVGPKGEKALCGSYQDFQRHCEIYLQDWLARRVADKLSVKDKGESLIPLTNYLSFVSDLLKGTPDEKVEVIWKLTANGDSVSAQEIRQYTSSIIESYLKCLEKSPVFRSWEEAQVANQLTPDSVADLAEYLLVDLLYKDVATKDTINQIKYVKESFSRDELEKCFLSSALLQQLHSSVAAACFRLDVDSLFVRLLPSCIKASRALLPEHYSVLDFSRILLINSNLPHELRNSWRFLFSTVMHGESFAKMVGQIEGKGATIVIVKDNGGRIFGAFATDSWAFSPKFTGDSDSFLFHLTPKFAIYPATGYNDNFQYLNVQQQTLPNGMGFGGKLEYFGIWLDAEFGKGKSSPSCTTYTCPRMASSEDFSIHHVEVWGVGPEPKKDENEREDRSILDKNPDAKVMLELAGRGLQSEQLGQREEQHCE